MFLYVFIFRSQTNFAKIDKVAKIYSQFKVFNYHFDVQLQKMTDFNNS